VYDNFGTVVSLRLDWRPIASVGKDLPVGSPERALASFERNVQVSGPSIINVSSVKLAYQDVSLLRGVDFLVPAYVFEYQSRTPIQAKPGVFSISKVLQFQVPAVDEPRVHARWAVEEEITGDVMGDQRAR
jgi:hypothetical protein